MDKLCIVVLKDIIFVFRVQWSVRLIIRIIHYICIFKIVVQIKTIHDGACHLRKIYFEIKLAICITYTFLWNIPVYCNRFVQYNLLINLRFSSNTYVKLFVSFFCCPWSSKYIKLWMVMNDYQRYVQAESRVFHPPNAHYFIINPERLMRIIYNTSIDFFKYTPGHMRKFDK